MSKQNKSPKKRKKKRTFRPKANDWGTVQSTIDARSMLGDIMLQSTDIAKSIIIYDTPFGKISAGEGADMQNLKNKAFLVDVLELGDDNEDHLNQLIAFEKLRDKYPDEPYVYNEIAEIYRRLGEKEKFIKMVKQNYEQFKGYLEIDLNYFEHFYETREMDRASLKEKIFGEAMNLHQMYPNYKAFEKKTVDYFYSIMATYFINRKEHEMAKNCIEVVKAIYPNSTSGYKLETMLRMREDATFRWKNYAVFGGLVLLIIAIVGWIIYGIVKFFQWIF